MQLLHLQPLLHDKQCTNGGVASQPELELQQTLRVCGPEPYKHPKTTKLNLNTHWMKCNKKIINIVYYCFLPSMNHFRFMKIQNICQLFCPTCFIGLSILISYIPCHLQLSCIYTTWHTPKSRVNSLEGSTMCSCGRLGLGRRSRLPAL